MPGVRLLFPVTVTISPVDRAGTIVDTRAREPVLQVARGAPVSLSAQVQFTERAALEVERGGRSSRSRGYLVVLVDDVEALSYSPRPGDKVTDIPGESGTFFVTAVTPHAHKNGRNQTLHLDFEDRSPVKVGGPS